MRRTAAVAMLTGALGFAVWWSTGVAVDASARSDASSGARLFARDCAICHGANAEGTNRAPALTDVGLASVDFQLRTGRMPRPAQETRRETPDYDREQIDDVLAYLADVVVSGPDIPDVDISGASLADGQRLYERNCAACHQSVGSGGVLAYDVTVPSLTGSSPVEVVEAMRTGPGQMPLFGTDAFDDREATDVAAYVSYLHDPDDRGGLSLGHFGPVPEGLVAVALGLASLVGVARLLGTREGKPS